jgi:hypothetical protein
MEKAKNQIKELQQQLMDLTKNVGDLVNSENISIENLKNKVFQEICVIDKTIMNEDTIKANMIKIKNSCYNALVAMSGILHLTEGIINKTSFPSFTCGYPLDFKSGNNFINSLLEDVCKNHFKRIGLQVCYEDSLYRVYSDFYFLKESEICEKIDMSMSEEIIINFIKNNLLSIGFLNPEKMLEIYLNEFTKEKNIRKAEVVQK